jgi:deoxyribodipyrimidine photo-lyase
MRIVHWFRNDLRLRDNTALAAAASRAVELLPVFIIDPDLVRRLDSPRRRDYLAHCLSALGCDLAAAGCPLLTVEGNPARVLETLVRESRADVVTYNRDYSPYADRRDRAVATAVGRAGGRVESFKDRVVFESGEVLTQAGAPFRIFTPYRNAWMARWMSSPANISGIARLPRPFATNLPAAPLGAIAGGAYPAPEIAPGEFPAASRLDQFLGDAVAHYAEHRDLPALDGTSKLSAALRFGTISIRVCVAGALDSRRSNPEFSAGALKWLDELIWRDFYQALLAEHPYVLNGPFQRQYRHIEWNDAPDEFQAWCDGLTGYPIVDAAMRQLVRTGWMHNRARMIVASFLVKDLLIDWRKGERFFLKHLLDGDPAANNGGWQWAASTGTDPQPYFRIFNPVSQGVRFDPQGDYVRRFVPELQDVARRFIHSPWTAATRPSNYPAPIVDHAERRVAAIARFAAARSRT